MLRSKMVMIDQQHHEHGGSTLTFVHLIDNRPARCVRCKRFVGPDDALRIVRYVEDLQIGEYRVALAHVDAVKCPALT